MVRSFVGDEMPAEAAAERLSMEEQEERNTAQQRMPEVWYRLNAPEKYRFGNRRLGRDAY